MVSLFLRVFHLQRQGGAKGKQSRMSFNHPKKLFLVYSDFVKQFKDMYFIVKPLTHDAEATLFEPVDYDENEEPKRGLQFKFPLEWQYDHFERGTEAYIFKDEDLNDGDHDAYLQIMRYVQGFRLTRCTTPDEKQIYDTNKQPVYAPRFKNMKAILECHSYREALCVLGIKYACYMPVIYYFFRADHTFLQVKWPTFMSAWSSCGLQREPK